MHSCWGEEEDDDDNDNHGNDNNDNDERREQGCWEEEDGRSVVNAEASLW